MVSIAHRIASGKKLARAIRSFGFRAIDVRPYTTRMAAGVGTWEGWAGSQRLEVGGRGGRRRLTLEEKRRRLLVPKPTGAMDMVKRSDVSEVR